MSQTPPDPPAPPDGGDGPDGGDSRNGFYAILAMVTLLIVGAVGAFVLLGDTEDEQRHEFVDAIATSGDPSTFPGEISETALRCMATAMVDGVGVERLAEVTTPEEIRNDPDFRIGDAGPTRAQAEAIADGAVRCVDFADLAARSVAATPGTPPDGEECLRESLTDDLARRLLVTEILEDGATEARAELDRAVARCVGSE